MELKEISLVASDVIVRVGLKILGAIVLWVVGRMVIGFAVRLVRRALDRQSLDPTLVRWMGSTLVVVLNVMLILAILSLFGVETTTFAALIAAAGVAIGVAWSGLLSNFAAGAFLITLRPFRVGDFVTAGGVTGTVVEIGLFVTTLTTPDNVRTIVGNNKIFADTIQNYSVNPYRRVDLLAQLSHGVDPAQAIGLLRDRLGKIPNVVNNPAPAVEILQFTPLGPVLAVRPYCNNAHYWQVYFDTNRLIRDAFGSAGFPVPEQHVHVRTAAAVGDGASGGRAART
jgi:small conductance mechanosensitive channel